MLHMRMLHKTINVAYVAYAVMIYRFTTPVTETVLFASSSSFAHTANKIIFCSPFDYTI